MTARCFIAVPVSLIAIRELYDEGSGHANP